MFAMSTPLIIIRGNSASGKTTLAHALQQQLGPHAFLISQDVIRRETLHVRDTANNPAIGLMAQLALDQRDHATAVILEGILASSRYRAMLLQLRRQFDQTHCYYFDLPRSTTLVRHLTRPQRFQFGPTALNRWWLDHDQLGWLHEHSFTAADTLASELAQIQSDLTVK